jgi:glycosyltransferase involved in cell wall biosynthesis
VDTKATGRVLILVENLSVPRDPRVWHEAVSLHRAGFEVVVVSPRGEAAESEEHTLHDGVEIHRFKMRSSSGGLVGYAVEYLTAMWRIGVLVRRLSRHRAFDVIHACNPPDLLLPTVVIAGRRGARLIFDHHDLVPELFEARYGRRGLGYTVARLLERLTFALADVVLATNESYREVAISRGGVAPENVFVVRNGPDPAVFARGAPVASLKRGKPYLLAYLGIMGAQDGVDYALRALATLRQRREDWHAVFAGDGEMLASLRELAHELGLEAAVEFVGRIDRAEIVELLSTADVCLAPEPQSPLNDLSTMVKIGEYMAFACPIVAFDLKESRFTAQDAGLYAVPNDPADFASRIDEFLDSPGLRSDAGFAGRERVEKTLAWKHSERELLAAYEHALSL